MFASCEPGTWEGEEDLELHEKSGELIALLRLLHDPPTPPTELPAETKLQSVRYDPSTVIPLPLLLSLLFRLADKYALHDSVTSVLRVHLLAHAPAYPLEVYGYATRFEEIKAIPGVVAYHKLVRLQDFRVKALRDLLLGEVIFPHGA